MEYKIEFTCGKGGQRVYKTNWTPVLNEKLNYKKKQPRRSSKLQQAFSRSFKKGWNPRWSYTY